ncbi:MAG: FtsX-like permease family protein, partial [Hyphomicrobiaceae bacterium]|nr:FtsX-like permease family protein [Hyphomicrobiaceae bacterium]
AQRRRLKDAVILKAIGVTRSRIMLAHLLEYAILATIAGVFAVGLGSLAAYIGLKVMDVPFLFSVSAVAQALGVAFMLVAFLGLMSTALVLRTPPVPLLKSE